LGEARNHLIWIDRVDYWRSPIEGFILAHTID